MKLNKCLLSVLILASVLDVITSEASVDNRRRLVVRKRKRPVGVGPPATSPQNALQNLQQLAQKDPNDFRGGRSLLGQTPFRNNFGARTQGASTFASLHNQHRSRAQHNRPRPNPVEQQDPYSASGVAHGNIQQVPGFRQHQLHLQKHQEQIQAHLAAQGGGRSRPRPNLLRPRPPVSPVQHNVRHNQPTSPVALPVNPRRAPVPQAPLTVVEHTVQHHAPIPQPQPHHIHHEQHQAPVPQPQPHIHHQAPVPQPHHIHHEEHHVSLDPLPVHQRAPAPVAIDLGAVAIAGEKCIDKIVVVEETESDEQIECHHSYSQKCHTTYTTDFEPQQEEKCEENFRKNCHIDYKTVAVNETVEFCHTPLVKDCNIPGPVECVTEYESECETRYHTHVVDEDVPECVTIKEVKCETKQVGYSTEEDCTEWPVERCTVRTERVSKATPETSCKKVPKEKCAPAGCGFVPGVPECFDKIETVVQEIPEETCDLEPHTECKYITTLVPNLQPSEECVDVPKEVCAKSRTNPRKVSKPVVKRWCYTPTPESGLF